MKELRSMPIHAWAEDDKPREKLMHVGRNAMSNAELIAILLGSGTRELSAVDLAKMLLQSTKNDLNAFGKLGLSELMAFKGIGEAKALTLMAAVELGRRRATTLPQEKEPIRSSADAFQQIRADLEDLPHEEFWILILNRANRVVSKERISKGGIAGTVADGRIIFKLALEKLACGIILVHNHPSGNCAPSLGDKEITSKLVKGGELLDIQVLDHLILADNKYFSFADEGLI